MHGGLAAGVVVGNSACGHERTEYDLAICGGGLAGLTLARQIKLQQPHWSVVLIDSADRPLMEAGHKVGESTVELGAYYLAEKLQLAEYLKERHFVKLGLRYFFGGGHVSLAERPEMGLSSFPPFDSYQIDRGRLENDLRDLIAQSGVVLIEGAKVEQISLSGDLSFHEVRISGRIHEGGNTLRARWVVDASGRRRFLQKQLGLTKEKSTSRARQFSSSWFRLPGRIDIDNLVSTEKVPWHDRVPQGLRYFSTTHLMGDGYWVWLIPLSSDYTSVGIVANELLHPFSSFSTYARSLTWLESHEPVLAAHLAGREPLDFRVMHDYSYSSKQVFSQERWACVGDAGVFVDPFYSPGTNMIGFANSIVIDMMRLDFAGELTSQRVEDYNRFFLGMNDSLTANTQLPYPFHGHAMVMAAKLIWDFCNAWGFSCPQMFYGTYLDPSFSQHLRQTTARLFSLIQTMQRLWLEWAALSPSRLTYDFFDYLQLDFLRDMRSRNLQCAKSREQVIADQAENMELVEQLAQALFLLAVEDVLPEHWDTFKTLPWLNAWRIGLKPESWEKDGLFRPVSPPADSRRIYRELRRCFGVRDSPCTEDRGIDLS